MQIVEIKTTGDKVQDRPLHELGGKALWTKELDRALLEEEVDFCVHSMKDVESVRPKEIHIAAVRPRGDVRDRLIGAESIDKLKQGAVVGTSSRRRAAQLLRLRPDLQIVPLRGNVETRLKKVESGEIDATLLAAAGLKRLEIEAGTAIPTEVLLPSPGQAVIGMECRTNDTRTQSVLTSVNNQITYDCVMSERAFTRALGATQPPVAAFSRLRWRPQMRRSSAKMARIWSRSAPSSTATTIVACGACANCSPKHCVNPSLFASAAMLVCARNRARRQHLSVRANADWTPSLCRIRDRIAELDVTGPEQVRRTAAYERQCRSGWGWAAVTPSGPARSCRRRGDRGGRAQCRLRRREYGGCRLRAAAAIDRSRA